MIWKAAHEPFIMFEPWSILKDEYVVSYFSEGTYKAPHVLDKISYQDAVELLLQHNRKLMLQLYMGSCVEWLHAFTQIGVNSRLYLDEQRARFKKRDLEKYPELRVLYESDVGSKIMQTLGRMPQENILQLSMFLEIVQGKTDKFYTRRI